MGRIFRHAVIIGYLVVSLAAFVYTMSRWKIPGIPFRLVHFSYGMMAPYQGDGAWNDDILAEGKLADGSWETIDLAPYFPYEPGEASGRKRMRSFLAFGEGVRERRISEFARQLLHHERRKGRGYESVRISQLSWERSPAGYDYLKHDPFLEKSVIAQSDL